MIEARAEATIPAPPAAAWDALTDLEHADWLPAVRGLRHAGGPAKGRGARFDVEVGLVGRHLQGILVCDEYTKPSRMTLVLEDGLDLTITVSLTPVSGGCTVELEARYAVGGAFGGAVERASAGAARREVGRALENFAARFGRKGESATGRTRSA